MVSNFEPGFTLAKQNLIIDLSFDFALQIIQLYGVLKEQKEYVLSKQLLRSGTSIGANVEEAIAAQSRNDFISKMSIASKEARETRYWLKLLDRSQIVRYDYAPYLKSIESIVNVLASIVKSTKENEGIKK
jgi:four helix bundle protein